MSLTQEPGRTGIAKCSAVTSQASRLVIASYTSHEEANISLGRPGSQSASQAVG